MVPKYWEPIEANLGGADAGKVLAEVMGIPFVVVRAAVRARKRNTLGCRLY
jgi:hypothetical protein